jgi:integrase
MPLKLTKRGTIYHLTGSIAGQRIRESTGLDNRRAADAYRLRRETEITERHAHGYSTTLTFAEAALTYLQAGGEARFLGPVLDYFGPDTLLTSIDNDAVTRAADTILPGRAPATINRQVITPISAVLTMAAEDGHVPPRRLRRRREPRGRLRWLNAEEMDRLLTCAGQLTLPRHSTAEPHTRAKIAFLIGSGCRTGECFAADVKDWHPATRQWWIPGVDTGAGKTAGAARMVRLPQRAVDLIGDLPDLGRAFRTPYGKPITLTRARGGQMAAAFNAARDAAGLGRDVTPHVLRHTWATWFYAQTRDFGALIDLGGWDKADTANRYRKIAPDDLGQRLLDFGWDFRIGTNLTQAAGSEPEKPSNVRVLRKGS